MSKQMITGTKTHSLLKVNQKVKDLDLEPHSTGVVLSVSPTIVRFGAMKVRYTKEEQLKYLTDETENIPPAHN